MPPVVIILTTTALLAITSSLSRPCCGAGSGERNGDECRFQQDTRGDNNDNENGASCSNNNKTGHNDDDSNNHQESNTTLLLATTYAEYGCHHHHQQQQQQGDDNSVAFSINGNERCGKFLWDFLGCIHGSGTMSGNENKSAFIRVTDCDQSAFASIPLNEADDASSAGASSRLLVDSLARSRIQKADRATVPTEPCSLHSKRSRDVMIQDAAKFRSLEKFTKTTDGSRSDSENKAVDKNKTNTPTDPGDEESDTQKWITYVDNKTVPRKDLKKEFPMGTRVRVAMPFNKTGKDELPISRISPVTVTDTSNTPVQKTEEYGSAVGWEEGSIVVHLDGHRETTKIPAECCTMINEEDRWTVSKTSSPPKKKQKRQSNKRQDDGSKQNNSVGKAECLEECDDSMLPATPLAPAFEPASTVKEALDAGGWRLKRRKNHLVYSRVIVDQHGKECEMQCTMPKTSSDHRSDSNTLARLNKFNRQWGTVTQKPEEYRHCKKCKERKPKSAFAANQWNHVGLSKCRDCCGKRRSNYKTND